jgi:hypothetical protein
MIMDPPRLRLKSGSWEARLLRSSPSLEPPAAAQEEVWRRLEKGIVAAGAATGALGIGAHTAAAAGKVAGKALWMWTVPWTAVAAVAAGVPAAGVATYWVVHRAPPQAHVAVVASAPPPPAVPTVEGPDHAFAPEPSQAATPVQELPPREMVKSRAAPPPLHATRASASALKAESMLLAGARSKLAAGDASGALDDIGRLSAQFPHGKLIQEREVVAIDCLAAIGDRAALRTRALAFRERFPNSPYTAHVREALGQ